MIRYTIRQLIVLVTADILTVWAALHLAFLLRISLEVNGYSPSDAFDTPVALYVLAPVIWIAAFSVSQVYNLRRSLSGQMKIANLVIGQLGATLLFWGLLYVLYRDFSRLQSFLIIFLSFVFFLGHRLVGQFLDTSLTLRNYQTCCVLIVGGGEAAERLADAIIHTKSPYLRFVGYVDFSNEVVGVSQNRPAVLGGLSDLQSLVVQYMVTDIVVSIKWFDIPTVELIGQILRSVERYDVSVRIAPDYSDVTYYQPSSDVIAGVPLIGIREQVLSPMERFIKRFIDVIFAVIALIACLPVFVLVAVAIRLDSPGPIILRQERIGFRGRPFTMYKFRSMYFSSDSASSVGSPFNIQKLKDDPRVTPVGRFIRRTSLDELPQFFNVLIGDMSIVGPRPEVPSMVEKYEWWQRKRFEVPQGMTGWWQVNGRADKPMYYHTSDDLYYISNYSLWFDFQIILRTILVVLLGRGAY